MNKSHARQVFEIHGDELLALYEDVRRYAGSVATLCTALLELQPHKQTEMFRDLAARDELLAEKKRDELLLRLWPGVPC